MAVPKDEPRRQLRVLIVDDNLDQVRTMAHLVRDSGHHADYAINGIVALEMAQRWKPDVMLLDLFLPDANGFEIARQLRRNPELKHIYIVGITGQHVEKSEASKNGFDDLLSKPLDFRVIEELLARVV